MDVPTTGLEETLPQPDYRITLTLAVTDPGILWNAAAAKLRTFAGTTDEDVEDVLGPPEDPSIADCIAALARPASFPGCVFDDFWVDRLRVRGPGSDVAAVVRSPVSVAATTVRSGEGDAALGSTAPKAPLGWACSMALPRSAWDRGTSKGRTHRRWPHMLD